MKFRYLVLALAALWGAAAVIAIVGRLDATSMSNLFALAVFATLPPLAIWFWWSAPAQTLSESIHEARDGDEAPRRPLARPAPTSLDH